MDLALASSLAREGGSKIVFCVIDGLGGLAREETLRSELEKADVTHLDRLAARSEVGLTQVVSPGVTPGANTALLALLGYDPLRFGAGREPVPPFGDTWKVRAVMFTGDETATAVANSAGIAILPGGAIPAQIAAVRERWNDFDFFLLHITNVAEAALAGDFERKCHALSEFDNSIAELHSLGAAALGVGGSRSIPALMAAPTWHPVPFLLHSNHSREGNAQHFNEQECLSGSLGIIRAVDVVPLLLAHALRLQPYGD